MKITKNLIFLTLLILILNSCDSSIADKKLEKEIVVERVLFQKSPMDSIYSLYRPSTEKFSLNSSETQNIISKNGTEILVPSNSFVDGFGNLVTGTIEFEILEANKLSDFVSCNLQTISNNDILESAGMIYLDAKSNGKSLRIAEDRKISISMPMMKKGPGFKMFSGLFDQQGDMNWIEDESSEKKYLIPFPMDLLYDDYHYKFNLGGYGYGHFALDSIKFNPRNEKYSNTLIHTREFRERYWKIHHATDLISTLLNKDYTWKQNDTMNLNDTLFQLYFSNLDWDIETLDSTATKVVYDFMESSEFNQWLSSEKDKDHYRYWFSENFKKEKNIYKAWFNFGSDGAKGNVPKFKKYEVDLLSDDAYNELISKGATMDEALTIINIEKERNTFLVEARKNKELREKKEKMQEFVQKTLFSTSELGWINCDRFLNDPSAGKAEIIVSIESETELEYTDCSLIIPSLNVKLGAFPLENNAYTFTKKDGVYIKLPLGIEAFVIGVSVSGGNCYFAYEKIVIEDGKAVTLQMNLREKGSLKKELDTLLSPDV